MDSRRLVLLFCAVATAVVLTGCSVTASLAPYWEEAAAISPREFIGDWSCTTGSDSYRIKISGNSRSGMAVRIEIIQTSKNPDRSFHGQWVPLDGMFTRIGDEYFLSVAVAVEDMLLEAERNSAAVWMLGRFFFLLQLTPDGDGFKLRFVTFGTAPENGGGWTPVGTTVKLKDNLVLNSTAELQELLKRREYLLDQTIYSVVRCREPLRQAE